MCVLPRANIFILARAAAFAALLLLGAGERVFAESGCLSSAASLDPSEIGAFLARPAELLDHYPAGGPAMSARVQRLAASDPSTISALVALAKDAKPSHVVALSIGLGRAATLCTAKRPDVTRAIRQLVAAEGSASLRALFSSEATVTELALGSLAEGAPSVAPGDSAQGAHNQAAAPSAETLNAIINARVPGFLFPTASPVPPGSAETRAVTPYRGGQHTSPPDGDGASSTPASSTPLETGSEAVLSSLNASSNFFAAFASARGAVAPLSGDEGDVGVRPLLADEKSPDGVTGFFAPSAGEASGGGTFRTTNSPTR